MLDRLPGSICQVLLYQWLTVIAIGRLDTALCVRAFRDEWSQLQRGTYKLFQVYDKPSKWCLRWCADRGMQFQQYHLKFAQFSHSNRFAVYGTIDDAVDTLSLTATSDSAQARNYDFVLNVEVQRFPCCLFWKQEESVPLFIDSIDIDQATSLRRGVVMTFSHLHTMSIVANGLDNFNWLPLAPNLKVLTVESDSLDDETIMAIAVTYHQLQHVRLLLPGFQIRMLMGSRVVSRGVSNVEFKQAMQLLRNLVSVAFTILKGTLEYLSLEPLLEHCPHLCYLALAGMGVDDRTVECISARGQHLQGLDLGEGHAVSHRGLSSLTQVFTNLKYFGLTSRTSCAPADEDALVQMLHCHASTLQEVSLWPSTGTGALTHLLLRCGGRVTDALEECRELRCLSLGTPDGGGDGMELVPILERCAKLRNLCLPLRPGQKATHTIGVQNFYPQLRVEYVQERVWPVWAGEVTVG